MTDLRYGVSC